MRQGVGKGRRRADDEQGQGKGKVLHGGHDRQSPLTLPALPAQSVAPALIGDLQRFGMTASRLSLEIEMRGGPADLRCIFRGMVEETDKQLKAVSMASTGSQQAAALSRISHMLKDAVEIAPAVGGGAPTKTAATSKAAAAGSCPIAKLD
jgi:hypothetical protein